MLNNSVLAGLCESNMTALGLDVESWPPVEMSGSSDMGNVSRRVPSIHPALKLGSGPGGHTREFAIAAGEPSTAVPAARNGALLLALAAVRLIAEPALLSSVRAEFDGTGQAHPSTRHVEADR